MFTIKLRSLVICVDVQQLCTGRGCQHYLVVLQLILVHGVIQRDAEAQRRAFHVAPVPHPPRLHILLGKVTRAVSRHWRAQSPEDIR